MVLAGRPGRQPPAATGLPFPRAWNSDRDVRSLTLTETLKRYAYPLQRYAYRKHVTDSTSY